MVLLTIFLSKIALEFAIVESSSNGNSVSPKQYGAVRFNAGVTTTVDAPPTVVVAIWAMKPINVEVRSVIDRCLLTAGKFNP